MANITRKWKRLLAVGCSHGHLANKEAQKAVMKFKADWKPHVVFELGDFLDTTAFRGGARGTPDESAPIAPDLLAGVQWLHEYEPTHVCMGNHEHRLFHLQNHHNAIVSHCATVVLNSVTDLLGQMKAKWVPYDMDKGWFDLGGIKWGHGYMFGEQALRDHAESFGNCVIAHLHRPGSIHGRRSDRPIARCVGTLSNIGAMAYAGAWRTRLAWGAGAVVGEYCDDESRLWLVEGHDGRWTWPSGS